MVSNGYLPLIEKFNEMISYGEELKHRMVCSFMQHKPSHNVA